MAAVVKSNKKEEIAETFIKIGLSFLGLRKSYCQAVVENSIMNYFVNYVNSSILV